MSAFDTTFFNNAAGSGGAIRAQGQGGLAAVLRLENCTLDDNTAENQGGAVSAFSHSDTRMTNCSCSRNSAQEGGMMLLSSGKALLEKVLVTMCSAFTTGGGAVKVQSKGSLQVVDSMLRSNNAVLAGGGAVFATGTSTVSVVNSHLLGNTAIRGKGGAMWATVNSSVTTRNSFIRGTLNEMSDHVRNSVENTELSTVQSDKGAGFSVQGSKLVLFDCVLSDLTSSSDGAGVFAELSIVSVVDSTFTRLRANVGACWSISRNSEVYSSGTVLQLSFSLFDGGGVQV